MKVLELLRPDPLNAQINGIENKEKALKVQKARVKAQKAQQEFRAAQARDVRK